MNGDYAVVQAVATPACPFCLQMFEDGIRGVHVEESLAVQDLAEIVAKAL